MLEKVDFSSADMSKEEFKPLYDEQLSQLVVLQQKARQEGIGLVVLFEGLMGSGRSDYISDLMYNLDARATSVHVTNAKEGSGFNVMGFLENGVTGTKPIMAEYWEKLGQRNDFTFFDGGWYLRTASIGLDVHRAAQDKGLDSKSAFQRACKTLMEKGIESAAEFERQLVDDGYQVVKFYNHAGRKCLNKRIKKAALDPRTSWMMDGVDTYSKSDYAAITGFFDEMISSTDFDFCPWVLLNGENYRQSRLAVVSTLVKKLEDALTAKAAKKQEPTEPAQPLSAYAPKASRFAVEANYPQVDAVDHSLTLTREEYKAQLKPLQKRLYDLELEALRRGIPVLVTLEGWDAAGKGGSIKRIAQALDARTYTIFPSPAPTKVELGHPHLWRYWTRLPKAGRVGLYDRTWYGRVLVERIEGFATPERWAQAYDEINAFERDLINWGAVLVKFWVDISPDEQLKRFEARQADPDKQWKITDEDWRNREKYPEYKSAIDDMFRLTSTTLAPWTVLESESKYYGRIKALKTVIAALEERLAK